MKSSLQGWTQNVTVSCNHSWPGPVAARKCPGRLQFAQCAERVHVPVQLSLPMLPTKQTLNTPHHNFQIMTQHVQSMQTSATTIMNCLYFIMQSIGPKPCRPVTVNSGNNLKRWTDLWNSGWILQAIKTAACNRGLIYSLHSPTALSS